MPRFYPTLLVLLALVVGALTFAGGAQAYRNPVIPGDFPDPTVVRVGSSFYASATSSAWAPLFPIFRSEDLVHWRRVGAVLEHAPSWATGRFWAPELITHGDRVLAYYSASRGDGRPCLGVAEAPSPEGPWRDHGRAACPPGGAIDASPFTDTDGTAWLLWKALGVGGAIHAQRLRPDGLRVTGPATVLVAPDAAWERGVTEGPTMQRRGDTLELFYAGGNCCRPPCTYAEGIARAPAMQGPWIKDPDNPILTGNDAFKCPGHGAILDLGAGGRWLLHHGYRADDALDARRSVLLTPVPDDSGGAMPPLTPPVDAPPPLPDSGASDALGFSDGFAGPALKPGWEWLFQAPPDAKVRNGALELGCRGRMAFVARQVPVDRFAAAAVLDPRARHGHARVGLAANLGTGVRGIELVRGGVRAFAASPGRSAAGPVVRVPSAARRVQLVVTVAPGGFVGLAAGVDGGAPRPVPAGPAATGGAPTRVALTCRGSGRAAIGSARVRALAAPSG